MAQTAIQVAAGEFLTTASMYDSVRAWKCAKFAGIFYGYCIHVRGTVDFPEPPRVRQPPAAIFTTIAISGRAQRFGTLSLVAKCRRYRRSGRLLACQVIQSLCKGL